MLYETEQDIARQLQPAHYILEAACPCGYCQAIQLRLLAQGSSLLFVKIGQECITELQSQGYNIPNYPEDPKAGCAVPMLRDLGRGPLL